MRLSDDRVNHLSHLIIAYLGKQKIVKYTNKEKAFSDVKRAFVRFLQIEQEIDQRVRRKIASLSRTVPEGSPEWEILYRKYMQEEVNRHS